MNLSASRNEIELIKHACGIGSHDPFYRDYFAAEPDSDDDAAWRRMVCRGWAEVRREPGSLSPLRIYGVTKSGMALIGKTPQAGCECFKRGCP